MYQQNNQSYQQSASQLNIQIQNLATYNLCDEHNDPFTNYCANLDCLRPLCPDCIDNHYRYHQQQQTQACIESIKSMKINCSRKIDTAIFQLEKEMNECEMKYLINPDNIINEGLQKLNNTREKVIQIIVKYFDYQEELLKKKVNQNLFNASDFQGIFNKITILIRELESLKLSLDNPQYLQSVNKICRLDLITLLDKFKSEILKTVNQRDFEPVQINIDEQKVLQMKFFTEQIVQYYQQNKPQQQLLTQNNESNRSAQNFQQKIAISNTNQNTSTSQIAQKPLKINYEFFDENSLRKNLHFFHHDENTGLNKLFLLNLNTHSEKNAQFEQIILDIDFAIPSFHKSIITPNDSQIYLMGGTIQNEDGQMQKSDKIYKYDFKKRILIKENENMFEGRSSFGICTLQNYIYVLGGINAKKEYMSSCERFNTINKKWEKISPLNFPSASFSCTQFNNKSIYKFGGMGERRQFLQIIEKYDVGANKWNVIDPNIDSGELCPTSFQILGQSCCTQINEEEIFIFGGYDENKLGNNLSFILYVNEESDEYIIQNINLYPLTISEGFSNPQAVNIDGYIYALQNVQSNNDDELIENMRTILQFNGRQWNILND